MSDFKSEIWKPKLPAIRCHYCPRIILKSSEPNGKLKLYQGMPICVVCRILKFSKQKTKIIHDRDKYQKSRQEAQDHENKVANDKAVEIAKKSQENLKPKDRIIKKNPIKL